MIRKAAAPGLLPFLAPILVIEAGLIGIVALSYQLTETAGFTDALAPRGSGLWNILFPALQVLDRLTPPVIGPDRTARAAVVALMISLSVTTCGYLLAIALLRRTRVTPRQGLLAVLGGALLFQSTLLVMPGIYSTDWFSYAMYGRMAAVDGLNPYVAAPVSAAADPLFAWVGWRDLTTPYGPVWSDISWTIATLTHDLDPVWQVLAYRGLAQAVQLGSVGLIWWLLGTPGLHAATTSQRLVSLALFAWNPLVLLEAAGSAHNDGLMVALVLVGLAPLAWLARRQNLGRLTIDAASRPIWLGALLAVVLSLLVKYVTVFLLPLWTIALVGLSRGWTGRLWTLALSAVVVVGGVAVLTLPWLSSMNAHLPLTMLLEGGERHANALTDAAAPWLADHILVRLTANARDAHALAHLAFDFAARAAFATYLGVELLRLWRLSTTGRLELRDLVRASTGVLLAALLLLLTQVLAWYFVWPVALASLLGWRSSMTRFSVLLSVTFLPVYYLRHYALGSDELLAWYVAVPLALTAVMATQIRTRFSFASPAPLIQYGAYVSLALPLCAARSALRVLPPASDDCPGGAEADAHAAAQSNGYAGESHRHGDGRASLADTRTHADAPASARSG